MIGFVSVHEISILRLKKESLEKERRYRNCITECEPTPYSLTLQTEAGETIKKQFWFGVSRMMDLGAKRPERVSIEIAHPACSAADRTSAGDIHTYGLLTVTHRDPSEFSVR